MHPLFHIDGIKIEYVKPNLWRQRGRVVRAPDFKSGDPEFRSRSDHSRDLFLGVLGFTPRLRLYIANWFASCQLGFLTC